MPKSDVTDFLFITANDIHISDVSPRSRTDDFKMAILDKLHQMCLACNKLKADAALIAGDLFNHKNPAKNSHALVRELIEVFKAFKCPIYMIEGNHDLTANRLESIEEQPLGVLFESGHLRQLREKVIEKNGKKVSLIGVPYSEGLDLSKLAIPSKGDCVAQICLLHIYAAPVPGMLFKDTIHGYRELVGLEPDVFVIGHYHLDQGITEQDGKYFVNIGSLSRGTMTDENINHEPQIGYIRISVEANRPAYTVQSLKLKVRSSSEIFDLKKREEEKKESQEITQFVDKLMTEPIVKADDVTFKDVLEGMDLTQAVRKKVLHYLEEAKR